VLFEICDEKLEAQGARDKRRYYACNVKVDPSALELKMPRLVERGTEDDGDGEEEGKINCILSF
jgi:hypothetical protein